MLRGATAQKLGPLAARFGARAPNSVVADYHFLLGKFVDRATLARAERFARQWGVHPHEVLIANGWVSAEDYAKALAGDLGLEFRQEISANDIDSAHTSTSLRASIGSGLIKQRGRAGLALSPPRTLRTAIRDHFAGTIAHAAVEELHARRPEESAREKLAAWQVHGSAFAIALCAVALLIDTEAAIRAISALLALIFIPVIALRIVTLRDLVRERTERWREAGSRIPDAELPIYTILVALFREAKVLPGLLRGLTTLDYPALGSKGTN